MARIRSVKPEFWTDGNMVALSRDARLFYIGLWNFAMCDQGHLEDDPLQLKLKIFPADDIDVAVLLAELTGADRLARIEGPNGRRYLHIVHLPDHQKVDSRWSTRCPACKDSPSLTETHPNSPTLTETRSGEGEVEVGDGRGGEGRKTSSPATPSTKREPQGFAEFYAEYPRKVGKDAARKAYVSALKRATKAQILLGAHRYATDPNLPEHQFIPHPATWLNGGHWDDEAQPPRSNGAATVDRQALILMRERERATQADAHQQAFPQIGA